MSSTIGKPRVNFASIKNPLPYPDFLEVQLKSFQDFLQLDTPPEKRKNEGLFKVFAENFPIADTRNNFVLEFLDYYIDQLNSKMGFKVTGVEPAVIDKLKQYDWPGNVRELRNVLERAMNFATADTLTLKDFDFFIKPRNKRLPDYSANSNLIEDTKKQAEKELIESVLERFDYNKTHAANFLNISRPLLHQKMNRLGIPLTPPGKITSSKNSCR